MILQFDNATFYQMFELPILRKAAEQYRLDSRFFLITSTTLWACSMLNEYRIVISEFKLMGED